MFYGYVISVSGVKLNQMKDRGRIAYSYGLKRLVAATFNI